MFKAERPDYAPVFGFARAISLEIPSLKFVTLDINPILPELEAAKDNIVTLLEQASSTTTMDIEYFQSDGVLHISRFVPEPSMNHSFEASFNQKAISRPLREAGVISLNIERLGDLDTMHFIEEDPREHELAPDELEVRPRCFSLNPKVSLYNLATGSVLIETGLLRSVWHCRNKRRDFFCRIWWNSNQNRLSRNQVCSGRLCGCPCAQSFRHFGPSTRLGLLQTKRRRINDGV